ncbi:MAG TPA: ABC transporter permease [Alphaproteobacteria bacterium]|nr:ABC transporter permease [Alphaproteobacteria bacterium]
MDLSTRSSPDTGYTAARQPHGSVRRGLALIGRAVRRRAIFVLMLSSLAYGVAREAMQPATWRRTVRGEFRRALRQAVGGGLATVMVTAALIGLAMVYQALYWLGAAGEEELIGPVLVTVLIREVAPVLVGLILLGRSGMFALSEICALQIGGQVRTLESQGVDPFQLIVLPRACAFVMASFTLGIFFVLTALISGFVAGSLLGAVTMSVWSFLNGVLLAMRAPDFVVFPVKMMVIGLLVALTACLTGLTAGTRDDVAHLLPRGFVRGVVSILLSSVTLSLAV